MMHVTLCLKRIGDGGGGEGGGGGGRWGGVGGGGGRWGEVVGGGIKLSELRICAEARTEEFLAAGQAGKATF